MAYCFSACSLALCLLVSLSGDEAVALDFRADFRSSTFAAAPSDTLTHLLDAHQSGSLIQSNVTTGLENISTLVYGSGVTGDYSLLMETSARVGAEGLHTF